MKIESFTFDVKALKSQRAAASLIGSTPSILTNNSSDAALNTDFICI